MLTSMRQLRQRLPNRSIPLGIANIATFAIQGLFAVLLLGLFRPEQVATFLVITQIAFFWQSLGLAQAQTAIITNRFDNISAATREAWRRSLLRLVMVAPLAYLAIYYSNFAVSGVEHHPVGEPATELLIWAGAIATCQASWYLAQAYLLRAGSIAQSAWVRVTPSLVTVLLASAGGLAGLNGAVLLACALVGFAVGALFLLPAWRDCHAKVSDDQARLRSQKDDRSLTLRALHTLLDGAFFTGVAVVWHGTYGAEQAGWLLTLMRLIGFVPGLVGSTWQQLVLAAPEQKQIRGLWVALASSALVLGLAGVLTWLASITWLPVAWRGVGEYALPVAIWQTSTCFMATFGYLAFARGRAVLFSWLGCIVYAVGLAVLILPTLLGTPSAVVHFHWLAGVWSAMNFVLALLMVKIPPVQSREVTAASHDGTS